MTFLGHAWQVRECKPGAAEFATALIALIEAEKTLKKARKAVPNYTGDRTERDYVANEQEAWNRAADDLYKIIP
jgi:hypothetical protein